MNAKTNFMNGLPELLVLRLLSREEMYGYQLVAEIAARSSEALNFSEGCIYPILHRLVGRKYLTVRREIVSGRPRHYYRTSAKGRQYVEELTGEWNKVVTGAAAILEVRYA
jgi:PadR family transcriptional regulator, regulatory protein PadR